MSQIDRETSPASVYKVCHLPLGLVSYFYSEIQDSTRAQAADVNVACRRGYQSPKTVVQRLPTTLESGESGGRRH